MKNPAIVMYDKEQQANYGYVQQHIKNCLGEGIKGQ